MHKSGIATASVKTTRVAVVAVVVEVEAVVVEAVEAEAAIRQLNLNSHGSPSYWESLELGCCFISLHERRKRSGLKSQVMDL